MHKRIPPVKGSDNSLEYSRDLILVVDVRQFMKKNAFDLLITELSVDFLWEDDMRLGDAQYNRNFRLFLSINFRKRSEMKRLLGLSQDVTQANILNLYKTLLESL